MTIPRSDNAASPEGSSPLRRLLKMLSIDDAIRYAVLQRIWQLLTGPVTQILIVLNFSRGTQDYYSAFIGLLGTQVFVELGLSVVLINVASHEWAGLKLIHGAVEGNPAALSRLASLNRMMLKWYAVTALLFAVVVSVTGIVFFQNTQSARADDLARENIEWLFPWLSLVLLNAGQLVLLPQTAILEGCHQLDVINRIRFRQILIGSVIVWGMLISGGGLWVLSASAAVRLAGEYYLVRHQFHGFFSSLQTSRAEQVLDWRQEILPLQWRIAVQGMVLWAATHLPLLYVFRGQQTGDAARLGMTWTILSALQAASLAWIETRRPRFGTLIAEKKYSLLDSEFFRMAIISIGLMLAGAITLLAFVWFINLRDEWVFVRLSERLLPVSSVLVYGAGFVATQPGLCANIYVRAHKRDPFLVAATVSNLALAVLQIVLGRQFGVAGVAWGYLVGMTFFQTPLFVFIWEKTRREWHAENSGAAESRKEALDR
ncbi:MAG: hypothetical protein KDA89_00910 [Planctomycetaceae bacterium]|nr:hypothetical protein [Planctomycetaceae bacterium]